jgi:hypothetical protein
MMFKTPPTPTSTSYKERKMVYAKRKRSAFPARDVSVVPVVPDATKMPTISNQVLVQLTLFFPKELSVIILSFFSKCSACKEHNPQLFGFERWWMKTCRDPNDSNVVCDSCIGFFPLRESTLFEAVYPYSVGRLRLCFEIVGRQGVLWMYSLDLQNRGPSLIYNCQNNSTPCLEQLGCDRSPLKHFQALFLQYHAWIKSICDERYDFPGLHILHNFCTRPDYVDESRSERPPVI